MLADQNEKAAQAAAEELKARGHKALAVRCDVSNDTDVEAADQTREDYDKVIGVNLRGVWSCMKYELQVMRKQRSGAIVNCSSLGGLIGGPERGIYHAAKHDVIGLTKSAATEYAKRGIRINDVCPGTIQTPMSDQMVAAGQGEVLRKRPATHARWLGDFLSALTKHRLAARLSRRWKRASQWDV